MNLAQDELIALGVSDEGINLLVDAALEAGALGSKLTGGGRGGCVMALAKNPEHAEKLANQFIQVGASKTWNFTLENSN
jgi:mevalonate kinase